MDHLWDRRGSGRWPRGFAGMVVLIVLCEAYLSSRAPDFRGDVPFAWHWGARMAQRDAVPADILCFGDSLVKYGLAPRVVEQQTGRSMWNLAVTGGRPANSYLLLRQALDAGAHPSAIVLDADLLNTEPFEIPYLWPQLASPRDAIEMAWVGRDADFFAHFSLAWALPSVRGRYEIRNHLLAMVRGEPTNLRVAGKLSDRNWKANRGASILPSSFQLTTQSSHDFDVCPPAVPVPGDWVCKPANAIYLSKFLDLAAARQIPVFWLFPPHYRMLERYFDRDNWAGAQRQFARDHIQRYPNLVVIDGLHGDYDRTVVMDVSHLNRRGAVAYSRAVGEILRDQLRAGVGSMTRWVELPAFAEPPEPAPVEDLAQSEQAFHRKR